MIVAHAGDRTRTLDSLQYQANPGAVVKQLYSDPSTDGPVLAFGDGQVQAADAMPEVYSALPSIPGGNSAWQLIEWNKPEYLDPTAFTTNDPATADPQYGNALWSWATPDAESGLRIYNSGNAAAPYVYELRGSGGTLHDGGGSNVFLSDPVAANVSFADTITYSLDAQLTQAQVAYDTPGAQASGAVLGSAFTGFGVWFNQPYSAGYEAALPSFLLYLQIGIASSDFPQGGSEGDYRSASLLPANTAWSQGSASLVYGSLLPGNVALPFTAAATPTKLTYTLNNYLEDAIRQPWPVTDTSGTTWRTLPAVTQDLSRWTLGGVYIGLETESSDDRAGSTDTSTQGSIAMALQVSDISVTDDTSQPYSAAGFDDPVRSGGVVINGWVPSGNASAAISTTPISTTSASVMPASTAPTSATPVGTTPTSTAPTSVAPTSATPVGTTPTSTAPASVAPTTTTPASTTPASTAPTSTAPTITKPILTGTAGSWLVTTSGMAGRVTLGAGAETVSSAGSDTVQAGSGFDVVYAAGPAVSVAGGSGSLIFVGGTGVATVTGGTGTAVIYAGTGGGSFAAGLAGGSILVAAGGNTTLTGAANGDVLFGAATDGSVLQAGAGAEILVAGVGATTLVGGSGTSVQFAGTAADRFVAGGGGAGQGSGGATDEVVGFRPGTDSLVLTGGTSVVSTHAGAWGTTLALSDGTQLVLFGVGASH